MLRQIHVDVVNFRMINLNRPPDIWMNWLCNVLPSSAPLLGKDQGFSLHHARDSEDPEFIHLSCAAYLETVYWESIESLLLGLLSGYMGLPWFTKIGDGSISTFWELATPHGAARLGAACHDPHGMVANRGSLGSKPCSLTGLYHQFLFILLFALWFDHQTHVEKFHQLKIRNWPNYNYQRMNLHELQLSNMWIWTTIVKWGSC